MTACPSNESRISLLFIVVGVGWRFQEKSFVFFCQSCIVCATKTSENLYQNLKIMKTLVPCMDGILWCSSKDSAFWIWIFAFSFYLLKLWNSSFVIHFAILCRRQSKTKRSCFCVRANNQREKQLRRSEVEVKDRNHINIDTSFQTKSLLTSTNSCIESYIFRQCYHTVPYIDLLILPLHILVLSFTQCRKLSAH